MELLERPVYQPLWQAARRRVESNGLSLDGAPLTLNALTAEELNAIAGLLGVHRPGGSSIRVPLGLLDSALRSSVVGQGLLDVLSTLGGPLVDRRATKERDEADRARLWSQLAAHPAVAASPRVGAWLDQVRTTGLARRLVPVLPAGDGDRGPGLRSGSPAGTRARGRRRITGARHPQRHLGE